MGRPRRFGNPFKVGATYEPKDWQYQCLASMNPGIQGLASVQIVSQQAAVDAFAYWIYETPPTFLAAMEELPGHDLACWCKVGTPCHGDYLLGMVNGNGE